LGIFKPSEIPMTFYSRPDGKGTAVQAEKNPAKKKEQSTKADGTKLRVLTRLRLRPTRQCS
jgi:hypothetical protein